MNLDGEIARSILSLLDLVLGKQVEFVDHTQEEVDAPEHKVVHRVEANYIH